MARLGLLFLLAAMVVPAWATFLVEENSLTVTSPDSIKGTYESAIGNFGIPQYGGTMSGTVKYPSANPKACVEFADKVFKPQAGERPTFALVDRGGMFPSKLLSYLLQILVSALRDVCFLG